MDKIAMGKMARALRLLEEQATQLQIEAFVGNVPLDVQMDMTELAVITRRAVGQMVGKLREASRSSEQAA